MKKDLDKKQPTITAAAVIKRGGEGRREGVFEGSQFLLKKYVQKIDVKSQIQHNYSCAKIAVHRTSTTTYIYTADGVKLLLQNFPPCFVL